MMLYLVGPSRPGSAGAEAKTAWSYPKYGLLRETQDAFSAMGVARSTTVSLSGAGEPQELVGEIVNAEYFKTLGAGADRGRTFYSFEDSAHTTERGVVLSHETWARFFGSDTQIVGRAVTLDNNPFRVVGILPRSFRGLTGVTQLWLPITMIESRELQQSTAHALDVVARRKPEVNEKRAQVAMEILGRQVDAAFPDQYTSTKWRARAVPLNEAMTDPDTRRAVLVLFAAVGCMLVITCINLIAFLMAREASRRRDMATRLALGARRSDLLTQALTENAVLVVMGGVAGLAVAIWTSSLLTRMTPVFGNASSARVVGMVTLDPTLAKVDSAVILYTLAVVVATGLAVALLPALSASRAAPSGVLRPHAATGASTRRRRGLFGGSTVATVQIALAFASLVTAALMFRSVVRLSETKLGFNPDSVLSFRIPLTKGVYSTDSASLVFERILERYGSLPGVRAAGLSSCAPLARGCSGTLVFLRDRPPPPRGSEPVVGVHFVSPGYFGALAIRFIRGRNFGPQDGRGAPPVVVINQAAAQQFWPNADPIGRTVGVGQGGLGGGASIVGVVADVRYRRVEEAPRPDVYIPAVRAPRTDAFLFVRFQGELTQLAPRLRQVVHEEDPRVPLVDVMLLTDRVGEAAARPRIVAALVLLLAMIALGLAAVGVYGVMSYAIWQERREIAIRIALGADKDRVLRLIIGRGLVIALAGIGTGTVIALGLGPFIASLLYGVQSSDPVAFAGVALLLIVVTLTATYIPARRAIRATPASTLRDG